MNVSSAGFWSRAAAFWLDTVVAYALAAFAADLAIHFNTYLPFEATLLSILIVESVVLTALSGGSLGKLLTGLRVVRANSEPVTWLCAVVRETVGKSLSSIPLALGFLWIGWTRQRRGWHDYLARTHVIHLAPAPTFSQLARVFAVGSLALAVCIGTVDLMSAVALYRQMAPRPDVLPFEQRDISTLIDIANVASNRAPYTDWLKHHGQSPVEYVVGKAQAHQLIIVGEIHEQRELLQFLNELIPRLYHDAGVTRIAMECCAAARNDDLNRLVTAKTFDRDLMLNIARHGAGGQAWGFKEYWDVLENVWRLNNSLTPDQPPMLVVGLFPEIDQPSVELFASPNINWWERLRIVRVIRTMPAVVASDAFYARQIEEQIIQPGHRGLVWVGYSHACLEVPNPLANGHADFPRMGFMLHQKYGDRVFQVRMHAPMIAVSMVDPMLAASRPLLPAFFDAILDDRGGEPVGFDVAGSPFAALRDDGVWEDHMAPRLSLEDRARGYVVVARSDHLRKCQWIADYVSPTMFAELKPYYQAIARREGQAVSTAAEFNHLFTSPSASKSK
ncbi:MAG: RDD family protein [Pirellulales bacterium]